MQFQFSRRILLIKKLRGIKQNRQLIVRVSVAHCIPRLFRHNRSLQHNPNTKTIIHVESRELGHQSRGRLARKQQFSHMIQTWHSIGCFCGVQVPLFVMLELNSRFSRFALQVSMEWALPRQQSKRLKAIISRFANISCVHDLQISRACATYKYLARARLTNISRVHDLPLGFVCCLCIDTGSAL